MDKIDKALKRLAPKELKQFKALLLQIQTGQLNTLDVKKLVGHADIYRVRKGKYRILFRMDDNKQTIKILALERRSDRTYSHY